MAEQVILGKTLIGAGGSAESDLARATQLALEAETSLGLGSEMPLLCRPPGSSHDALLYNPLLGNRVNHRLEAAEALVRDVVQQHRDVINPSGEAAPSLPGDRRA